ncbi:cupin domain-containing protein [Streptomyces sp. NPDC015131]|uniref:cupin domain-containing protein n=1 Tax=Streptomyces sp. NPDC015131 TaxID=3364941 RepID=UPI0036FFDB3D
MAANPGAGVLARLGEVTRGVPDGRGGALWRLAVDGRQLDANVVRLAPGAGVAGHVEPDLDVLLYVVEGDGRLGTGEGERPVEAGCLVWLPRGARRGMVAGPEGLAYLTVHRRRPGLTIGAAPAARDEGGEAACLLPRVCPDCGRPAPDEADVRFCGRCGSRLPARD